MALPVADFILEGLYLRNGLPAAAAAGMQRRGPWASLRSYDKAQGRA